MDVSRNATESTRTAEVKNTVVSTMVAGKPCLVVWGVTESAPGELYLVIFTHIEHGGIRYFDHFTSSLLNPKPIFQIYIFGSS